MHRVLSHIQFILRVKPAGLRLNFDFPYSSLRFHMVAVLLAAWLLVLPSIFASTHKRAAASDKPVIAFAGRIVGDAKRARLIMDFDTKVEPKFTLLADPRQLVIDLPETLFSLDKAFENLPATFVSGVRHGALDVENSRIVVDLSGPAKIHSKIVRAVDKGARHRLILDLVQTDEVEFAKLVSKPEPKKKSVPRAKAPQHFTVFLDPGHGGIDGGATGVGRTVEKDITLQFALKLRERLEKNPAFTVILSRSADKFVSLTQRVALARKNQADLLVSIHADSLKQRDIRGATVYTLSDSGSDDIARSLADTQNRADLIAGFSLPKVDEGAADILIDLMRRETTVFSTRFADLMVERMRGQVRLIKNPHRSGDFFVLKAPEVPSVLLELGYLSNNADENLMASDKWQDVAVEAANQAITEFFSTRLSAAKQ